MSRSARPGLIEIALVGVLVVGMATGGCSGPPENSVEDTGTTPPPGGEFSPQASATMLEAAFAGRPDLVRETLANGADPNAVGGDGRTGIMLAAFDGHTEIVELLLDRGAEVDIRDPAGRTGLMYAASGPHSTTVRLLLDRGADPQVQDNEEQFTALMFAASEGQAEVARVLLEHGADSTIVDADGDTALDFANQKGHREVASLLGGE